MNELPHVTISLIIQR